jgi:hypothetical protein
MDSQAGDWREYSRLVLTELERHNDLLLKIHEKLDTIRLQQALSEQTTKDLKKEVDSNTKAILGITKRVEVLEAGGRESDTLQKYRKYLIAGAIGIFVSIVLPITQIILRIKYGS